MRTKEFCGNTVSNLGLGLMRLPRKEDGSIDYEQGMEMVDIAINNGINYFDTAYPYHDGESEIFTGKALKRYPRDSFYLATKMPIWVCKTKEDVRNIFFKQLEKCQVEYFDYYLCHAMSLERHHEYLRLEAYDTLLQLKKEGYIKNLGFSFHDTPKNLLVIVDAIKWDFTQIQLNYLDWTMQDAKQQYEILEERNIPTIVMEPVRGGVLANVSDEVKNIFKKYDDRTPASWALRYVAALPNVKVILSGMSNIEQLNDNIKTFNEFKELTNTEKDIIEEAKKAILGNKFIPCTGCRYCIPCPFGVEIPRVFAIYNQFQIDKDQKKFTEALNNVSSECKNCLKCLSKCPQSIKIPSEINKVKSEL